MKIKLIRGDCLKEMARLTAASIDFIFTDPPYGHNNNNGDLASKREQALGVGVPGKARPIANDGIEANDIFRAALSHLLLLLLLLLLRRRRPGSAIRALVALDRPGPGIQANGRLG